MRKSPAPKEAFSRSAKRIGLALFVAFLGLAGSRILSASNASISVHRLEFLPAYGKAISALLAVGLFASAFGIHRRELRYNARVLIAAITFGVAVKAILTGSVMALAYGSIAYLMLGVAVAQIDPLSVAAMLRHSDMSERASSVLSAWASFDDPVTILLVVYLTSFTLPHAVYDSSHGLVEADFPIPEQAVLNAVLVAVGAIAWYVLAVRRRTWRRSQMQNIALCAVLVCLIVAAVQFNLLIGIAVCGLFFRPPIGSVISRLLGIAFYASTFLLGMLLSAGVSIFGGLLLGLTAFLAQVLASSLITRGMPREDRFHLALGQQNGLTAIILALALHPYLPTATGIIAIAILVVNVLHIACNGILDCCLTHSGSEMNRIRLATLQGKSVADRSAPQSHASKKDRLRIPAN